MDMNTLAETFCDYSAAMRGYLPDTIKKYRTVLRVFARATHVARIDECTDHLLRGYFYRGRVERNWTPATFMTYRNTLVVFFRWCVELGHLVSNPVEGLERPKIHRRLPRRLTADEAHKLLERIANYPYRSSLERHRDYALIAMVLYAGLRRSEVIRLNVTDVDLEGRSIFVRLGKGAKDRVVPMASALAVSLGKYLELRRQSGKTCPQFFTSLRHDAGLTKNGLKSLMDKLQRITETTFRMHMLRHTFATLMLEGGCDLFALSRMMGHSDIKTTTIYLAASVEHLRAQVAKHPLTTGQWALSSPLQK